MNTLGEKLKALRRASGRTLKEVTDALGLAAGHLGAIESGKIANPRAAVVATIAEYYGADLGELLELTEHSGLSAESNAIIKLFEEKLTPNERVLILRYAQLLVEHLHGTSDESDIDRPASRTCGDHTHAD